eukprot:TRINITY_DN14346_c0_g1_i1.p1 TRINITY_DN14346_c0_g1~~TRINITY_DN14346_c0_g1_i1.p1  ORF type:complete len:226 (-),score=22.93 TRINITY_DN14346_c0_g1_i1:266-943(-)
MAIVKQSIAAKRNKAVKLSNNTIEQFKALVAKMPKAIEQEHAKLTGKLVTMKKSVDKAKIESNKFKSNLSSLVAKHPGKKSAVVTKQITKMKADYRAAAAKWETMKQENEAIKNQVALAKNYIKIAKQTAMFIVKLEKELLAELKLGKSAKTKPVTTATVKAKPAKATAVKLGSGKTKTKIKPQIKDTEHLVNNNEVNDFVESSEKELAVVTVARNDDELLPESF